VAARAHVRHVVGQDGSPAVLVLGGGDLSARTIGEFYKELLQFTRPPLEDVLTLFGRHGSAFRAASAAAGAHLAHLAAFLALVHSTVQAYDLQELLLAKFATGVERALPSVEISAVATGNLLRAKAALPEGASLAELDALRLHHFLEAARAYSATAAATLAAAAEHDARRAPPARGSGALLAPMLEEPLGLPEQAPTADQPAAPTLVAALIAAVQEGIRAATPRRPSEGPPPPHR
jgi:hypothetical protein